MKRVMQATRELPALRWFSRTILYGSFIEVLLAVLYTVGNYQKFTDNTQVQIVSGLQTVSSIVFVGAAIGALSWIVVTVTSRKVRYPAVIIGMVGIAALSAFFALGATTVIAMLKPI